MAYRNPKQLLLSRYIYAARKKKDDPKFVLEQIASKLGGYVCCIPTTNGRPGLLVCAHKQFPELCWYDMWERRYITGDIHKFMRSKAGLYIECI